jgi:membrane associated rhomboid family serine protease
MKHTIQEEIKGIVAFVAGIWIVFLLEFVTPLNLVSFGLTPRTATGLIGIPAMPFLHADWRHITSNTPPLLVLLILLAGSKAQTWKIVIEVILLGGMLLWLFGRTAMHIGASGLIFGLIAFLIVSGLLEKRFVPLLVSMLVGVLYGGSLLSGIVPRIGSRDSWDGHLFGAIAGVIVAYALTRRSVQVETRKPA